MGNCKKKHNLVKLQAYMKKEHDKVKKLRVTKINQEK